MHGSGWTQQESERGGGRRPSYRGRPSRRGWTTGGYSVGYPVWGRDDGDDDGDEESERGGRRRPSYGGRPRGRGWVRGGYSVWDGDDDGDEETAPPRVPLQEIVKRLVHAVGNHQALGVKLTAVQYRRIPCVLWQLLDPARDDRAVLMDVSGFGFRSIATTPLSPQARDLIFIHLRPYLTDLGNTWYRLGKSDADMLAEFRASVDERIAWNVGWLMYRELDSGGGSMNSPAVVAMHDWVSARQRDRRSIYACYR